LIKRRQPSRHVTILDVARESGFSASTVSIVLNEAPLSQHVAAKTKERIRSTAKALGYRPDIFAQSLRRGRTHTIGVMIFDISDPFCTLILRGIEKAVDPTTYLPIIMDAHNERKQFERYLAMLLERRVEGLIVVANWLFSEIDLLPEVPRHDIPMVVVGRDMFESSISSVIVDNEAGGYAALKHIFELGHRKIAFVRGPAILNDSSQRWKGIRKFARERGLSIDDRLVRQLPGSSDPTSGFEGGHMLTHDLIESGIPFTALIAFDDLTALGAVRALHRAGRSIPADCSVIGFDDVPPAALSSPSITSIRQPMEEMGGLAAKWMLEALAASRDDGQPAPPLRRSLLPPSLVVRDSTIRIR
jgi:LacI family transcriptional regulator